MFQLVAQDAMRDLIDAPNLDAFVRTEGLPFTVRTAEDAELVLDRIDTRRNTRRDWERFTLTFRGPADEVLEKGLHRLHHPRLNSFDVHLSPVCTVKHNPEEQYYQATFSRRVPGRETPQTSSKSWLQASGGLAFLESCLAHKKHARPLDEGGPPPRDSQIRRLDKLPCSRERLLLNTGPSVTDNFFPPLRTRPSSH